MLTEVAATEYVSFNRVVILFMGEVFAPLKTMMIP